MRRSAAPVFAALGDATRLELVRRLCASGPQSVTELAAGTPVTRQAIAKHLGVLAGAGLVRDLRRGRERLWELDAAPLDAARACLDEVAQAWDRRLARLKALVES